mmetsp:Transcript_163890/g.290051  ORF Transcript_163890/g.290051 Transcript_163890/m.290051 type:complete len:80 (-) Transcript_163890:7-246(-)
MLLVLAPSCAEVHVEGLLGKCSLCAQIIKTLNVVSVKKNMSNQDLIRRQGRILLPVSQENVLPAMQMVNQAVASRAKMP